MIERGIVTKCDGQNITVRLQMSENCRACASGLACSSGKNEVDIWDRNKINPEIGDTVDIQITTRQQIESILLLIVLPFGLFALGYFIHQLIFPATNQTAGIFGGIFGIILGIILGSLIDRRRKQESMPYILRKVISVDGSDMESDESIS